MREELLGGLERRFFKGSFENSKKIDVLNLKRILSEELSYLPSGVIGIYGIMGPYSIAYQLKKYAGIDTNILLNRCSFEHGPYFSKIVCQMETTHHANKILVFSPFREEVIRELTDIIPVAIGPYIAYAEEYRSGIFVEKVKEKTGRILLAMPSHSTEGEDVNYNVKEFIQRIEVVKKDFDKVMVCIHFEDLKKGLWKPYKEKGYCVVSAGNIRSPYFLSRTKYIFHLADALLVNTVTTGMAYAMYMNCPIRLVRQKISYNISDHSNRTELEFEDQIDKAYELFEDSDFIITEEQKEFGNYLFGLENVKPKEEMKKLLMSLTRMNGQVD